MSLVLYSWGMVGLICDREMDLEMGAEKKQKDTLGKEKNEGEIIEDYEDSDDEAESIIGNNVVSVIGTAK